MLTRHIALQRVRAAEEAVSEAQTAVQQRHREFEGTAPASIEVARAELQSERKLTMILVTIQQFICV